MSARVQFYTDDEVRSLIYKSALPFARTGTSGVRPWAEYHGISSSHISEFLSGKRNVSKAALAVLGLEFGIVKKRQPPPPPYHHTGET